MPNILTPRTALNKAFLKQKPYRADIEEFKANFKNLLSQIDTGESEEFHKNALIDFLKNTWYSPGHYINTKGRTDLVIHNEKTAKSNVGVIVEAKSPANQSEMVGRDNLNAKAFHELLLYFLRERITHGNKQIRHLVITNVYEWFIFDAAEFENLFASHKTLVNEFREFEEKRLSGYKTDFFYQHIARPFLDNLDQPLSYTYFDVREYEKQLYNGDKEKDRKLIALYKLLSPQHLLKLPFANDSNTLDRGFYSELLHIIGLKEVKEKGKKLIERKDPQDRDPASLLENTIYQLDSHDKLSRLENLSRFGATREERLYNVALELVITWMNRVLFLKLLEAQLVSYHRNLTGFENLLGFLNIDRIRDYDELDSLFFSVLARKQDERPADVDQFQHVPYLNSALFDPTDLEQDTFFISGLKDNQHLDLYGKTVLRQQSGHRLTGRLNAIEYLFRFLDAYDFSSEGGEDIQEENKTLINASVLGLIFEKINGYRDGSFFTPGFITEYMCRQTIRRAVTRKFNERYNLDCDNLDEVRNFIGTPYKQAQLLEYNAVINDLKICDPAVGSGHFLVSALNELLAIKHELGILCDQDGNKLSEVHLKVENDELIITLNNEEIFEYHPSDPTRHRIQKALFHEKETLIENCLFGVDINPNSVKICRLRLWIELLKHAYYQGGGQNLTGFENLLGLETLPNIDINIKCGNSLISRFGLDADLKKALKKSKYSIDGYRVAVQNYREAETKDDKRQMQHLIREIKSDFRSEIRQSDPKVKKLQKLEDEYYHSFESTRLIDVELTQKEKAAQKKKQEKLHSQIEKLRAEIDEIKNNKIYENAFEWRFEFPEVLDDDGRYRGFDVVIGNPPYIRQEAISWMKPYLQTYYDTYAGTADLYVFFVELGMRLLQAHGQFAYILPNKWMRAGYGKALRQFVSSHRIQEMTDFGDLPVFEEATTYPCLMFLEKAQPTTLFPAANVDTLDFPETLHHYLTDHQIEVQTDSLQPTGWVLTDRKVSQLLEKIRSQGTPLGEYVDGKIYRGVLTGLNEAFVIDEETKDRLIAQNSKSAEVIKPFLTGRNINRYEYPQVRKYLLFIPWHFPLHMDDSISGASEKAEINFKKKYPAIYSHLNKYRKKLEKRNKAETGIRYEWYALQRCAATYFEEFEEPKILWPGITSDITSFGYDQNGYFGNDNVHMIITNKIYLLAILNSYLSLFYLKNTCDFVRGGYIRLKIAYIETMPIPNISGHYKEKLEMLVDQVLEGAENKEALIAEIDEVVFDLFGLSEEEREMVFTNPSINF